MIPETTGPVNREGQRRPSRFRAGFRAAFRRWRRTRPFWGGLFIILSGLEIFATERAPMRVVLHVGLQGLAGYAIPIVLVLLGVLLWVNPAQRLFYSLVAAVLVLASWLTSNLGGFLLGLLIGIIGAAMAFGWVPQKARRPTDARLTDARRTDASRRDGRTATPSSSAPPAECPPEPPSGPPSEE
jgi:Family of unknown function (DUF6114)